MDEVLPYKAVLVDYDDDLFTPKGWEGDLLARAGLQWLVGQHRTPETVLEAARDADVVMVQSVRPLLSGPLLRDYKGAVALCGWALAMIAWT